MEQADWIGTLDDYDEDLPCLTRDACLDELLRDASAGCLYCKLSDIDDGEDE